MGRLFLVYLFFISVVGHPFAAVAATPASLDFVHVEANVGEAAGGHFALRLGSTVFHYQFFPDNRFLLVRDNWDHFSFFYSQLRNRSLHITAIPVTPPVLEKIHNHFTQLRIRQQQELDRLALVEQEHGFLIRATARKKESRVLALPGLGLFARGQGPDPDMGALFLFLAKKLGRHFLARQRQQISCQPGTMAADGQSASPDTWFIQVKEQLLLQAYLQLLASGAPLADKVILKPLPQDNPLSVKERKQLAIYRGQLMASIQTLLAKPRPERAFSLLVQTARYLVVCKSLSSGQLFSLDPFSARAFMVNPVEQADVEALADRLQTDVCLARKAFFSAPQPGEMAYAALESARGRFLEVAHRLRSQTPIRVEPGPLLPSRTGMVSLDGLDLDQSIINWRLKKNTARYKSLHRASLQHFSYDLIERNCATALVRALEGAFADQGAEEKALHGRLSSGDFFVFIPWVLQMKAGWAFAATTQKDVKSHRLALLDDYYENKPLPAQLGIWLRESNTLSSTLYAHRPADTPFLLFTDNTVAWRPLFGLINAGWGAMYTLAGLASLPVDGGEGLYQGARGVFYSLPEIFFANIRKGTYGAADLLTTGP